MVTENQTEHISNWKEMRKTLKKQLHIWVTNETYALLVKRYGKPDQNGIGKQISKRIRTLILEKENAGDSKEMVAYNNSLVQENQELKLNLAHTNERINELVKQLNVFTTTREQKRINGFVNPKLHLLLHLVSSPSRTDELAKVTNYPIELIHTICQEWVKIGILKFNMNGFYEINKDW